MREHDLVLLRWCHGNVQYSLVDLVTMATVDGMEWNGHDIVLAKCQQ